MRRELSETIESFDLSAVDYDQSIATLPNYDETYQMFCSLLKPKDKILDLACGPGTISMCTVFKSISEGTDACRERRR